MRLICYSITDELLSNLGGFTISEACWPELSLQSASPLALICHLQSVVVRGDARGPSTYRSPLHHITAVGDLRERPADRPHSRCWDISNSQTLIAAGIQQKQRTGGWGGGIRLR